MTNKDLPVKSGDDFLAECEVMDLGELHDKTFIVGVSQGERSKCKFLSSTVYGPYTFYEMCEEVGVMWQEHQHHAKVTILGKDKTKAPLFLDENTVDYVEAHFADIITDGLLEGVFDDIEYTCKAGVVEADNSDDPRANKDEEKMAQ